MMERPARVHEMRRAEERDCKQHDTEPRVEQDLKFSVREKGAHRRS
jgi:hypothetical protein